VKKEQMDREGERLREEKNESERTAIDREIVREE
jgi:hypothetical protein